MAILDFNNRKVYIFVVELVPYFNYGVGCAGSGDFVPELALSGPGLPGTQLTLSISQGLGGSTALLFVGLGQGEIPLGGGCRLLTVPLLPAVIGPLPLGGAGAGTGALTIFGGIPVGVSGVTVTLQSFVVDPGVIVGFAGSNGVQLDIP